jgi:hypothetical protein
MNIKKATHLLLMFVVLSCCLVSFDEAHGVKYKCYKLYASWTCMYDGNYNYLTWHSQYVALYTEPWGLYYDSYCDCGGEWNIWKNTMTILYNDEFGTFMSGNKKQGFYNYSDGSWNTLYDYPGCWYLKKMNCKKIVWPSSLENIKQIKDARKKEGSCLPMGKSFQ